MKNTFFKFLFFISVLYKILIQYLYETNVD